MRKLVLRVCLPPHGFREEGMGCVHLVLAWHCGGRGLGGQWHCTGEGGRSLGRQWHCTGEGGWSLGRQWHCTGKCGWSLGRQYER